MYRIEFNDACTLRDCITDNPTTANAVFHYLSKAYSEVYLYRVDLAKEVLLLASHD